MAANDTLTPSLQGENVVNKAELPFYTSKYSDWTIDYREKTSSFWEVSSKEVSGYESVGVELTKFMSLIPTHVSRIEEPGQRYLCITYGPTARPFYIYLDFSQQSRKYFVEWQEVLEDMMGRNSTRRRKTMDVDSAPCKPRDKRPKSAFQLTGVAETSSQEGEDESVDSDMSQPSSLHSLEDGEMLKIDYRISLLQEERDRPHVDMDFLLKSLREMMLSLADYKDGVYVSDVGGPCSCNLNIGDRILQITSQPVKNAQDAREKMDSITDGDTKVAVRLQRFPIGNLCVIHPDVRSSPELGIDFDGSKITEMSPAGAFRRSCDPKLVWFEQHQSERSISSINERPISFHSTSHEVENVICEACDQVGSMVFHVHPTEFLKAISPDSTKL